MVTVDGECCKIVYRFNIWSSVLRMARLLIKTSDSRRRAISMKQNTWIRHFINVIIAPWNVVSTFRQTRNLHTTPNRLGPSLGRFGTKFICIYNVNKKSPTGRRSINCKDYVRLRVPEDIKAGFTFSSCLSFLSRYKSNNWYCRIRSSIALDRVVIHHNPQVTWNVSLGLVEAIRKLECAISCLSKQRTFWKVT